MEAHSGRLIADLSGEASIRYKAKEFNIDIEKDPALAKEIIGRIKEMEMHGYQFEGAEGSLELLMKKKLGIHRSYFELIGFRIIVEKKETSQPITGSYDPRKGRNRAEHTAALGKGPVNALDNALRKALQKFYPDLKTMDLVDYKVRVLSTGKAQALLPASLLSRATENIPGARSACLKI